MRIPSSLSIDSRWWILGVALFSLVGAGAVALATGVPRPGIADEFSYLLGADTFARLRLTNPAHPLWEHFEAFWVLVQPTYSPKYPPGQSLTLAVGQWLGHPVIGVWLGAAAMCAAITWMLRAWVPARWALFGGVLVVLKFGVSEVWAQSYMGGAVAACGGALLFGGLRRIVNRPRTRDAIWMGLGLVILANSRPFEGFLLSLPAAALFLVWLLRRRGSGLREAFSRVVIPVALLLAAGAGWIGLHNRATTGSALRLPYSLYMDEYPIVPIFVWEKVPPTPRYRHWMLEEFQRRHRRALMKSNPPGVKWHAVGKRLDYLQLTFVPGLTWAPFILLPFALRNRWTLFALACCLFMLAGQLLTLPPMPYTSAPATGLFFLLIVQSVRTLEKRKIGRLSLARAAVLAVLGIFAFQSVAQAKSDNRHRWVSVHTDRPRIEADLAARGGRHVIVVRYGPFHNVQTEWVYNLADIDSQAVVWAQDRGEILNRRLLDYYSDRSIWVLKLGFDRKNKPRLEEYRPDGSGLIDEQQIPALLEWVRQKGDPEVRESLLGALLDGSVVVRRPLAPGAFAAGLRSDGWSRSTQPAAIAIRNPTEEAIVPRLRLRNMAPDAMLPLTVWVDDGAQKQELIFTSRGEMRPPLDPIPPGEERLFLLWSDQAFQPGPKDRRWLGFKLIGMTLEPAG